MLTQKVSLNFINHKNLKLCGIDNIHDDDNLME